MSTFAAAHEPAGTSQSAEAKPLLDREAAVWRLLRSDSTIDPADALAAVVWPPRDVLVEAGR